MTKVKYGFEQIKISDRLDEVVENTINNAIKDKRRNKKKSYLAKCSTGVAGIFVAFAISVNCIPAFAQSIKNIPVLSTLASAVQINYSKNIGNAINQGYADDIHQTKMANNIKISIRNVISDNKNLYILYTLDGKMDKNGLKNILLNNLQITDNKNNILVDTEGGKEISQVLTNRTIGKQGNILIPMNSHGYNCVVSSLGNSLESYSQKQETTGILQLTADGGREIPEEVKLTFLGFTEAYNTTYSKETYDSFVLKFNRKPMNLDVNCSFNIKIDKKLNSIQPEKYSNIKFAANNTDFEIKNLIIYPTYIEAKIHLGKNKVDNTECIGGILNEIGLDTSTLPYLIDEKGNKYMPHKSHGIIDSDNCQTITFESSYFNQTKELYLVVNQVNCTKIAPVKVKIK